MRRDVIVGSLEDFTGQSVKKKCESCGQDCYFHDQWDFKKYKIICIECAMEIDDGDAEFLVHPMTVKNIAKLEGIEEWEANILINKIMERGDFLAG